MAKSTKFLGMCAMIILFLSYVVLSLSAGAAIGANAAAAASQDHHHHHHLHHFSWNISAAVEEEETCGGTVAECIGKEEEEEYEINRRILASRRYISYGALRRNTVPCSRRGASYYNCRPGGPANPYSRGCSAITRCRR